MPQLEREMICGKPNRSLIMPKSIVRITSTALLAAACVAAAAQAGEEYAANLGALYGERFWMQAHKDVCISVVPKERRNFQEAYEAWLARHEEVIGNLELRVAAMVKGVSRDEAEYRANYNKYYNAVMHEREEEKSRLRKLPQEDLLKRCKELPGYLRGSESDMYNTHARAFDAIYGKKQP